MDKILSLEIVNFKTFKHLKIDDLDKNINFIYGQNNVGKTSIFSDYIINVLPIEGMKLKKTRGNGSGV